MFSIIQWILHTRGRGVQEPVAMNDINVSNKCITEHLINRFFIKVEGKEQGQKLKESTAQNLQQTIYLIIVNAAVEY